MPMQTRSFTTTYEGKSNVLANDVLVARAHRPSDPPEKVAWKRFLAVWDTGATNTVITARVAQDCGLKPTGMAQVYHAGGKTITHTYLVNILLPNGVEVGQLRVTQGAVGGQADILIGMDIIGQGDFAVTNKDHKTVFSFRIPSVERIDFVKNPYKEDPVKRSPTVGRNDPCPCGSGKKYTQCCLNKDN